MSKSNSQADLSVELYIPNTENEVTRKYNNWAASWQNQQSECAPSEDSDQPGHPPSLIRVFAVRSVGAKDPSFLHADSEDSDQTGRMPRLIWVFAGRTTTLLVLSRGGSYACWWNTSRLLKAVTLYTKNREDTLILKTRCFACKKISQRINILDSISQFHGVCLCHLPVAETSTELHIRRLYGVCQVYKYTLTNKEIVSLSSAVVIFVTPSNFECPLNWHVWQATGFVALET